MSVLETFLYDPLCEWSKGSKKALSPESSKEPESENEMAVKTLKAIDRKLRGFTSHKFGFPLSTEGQVSELINQATNMDNLSKMYIGWAAFM